MQVNSIEPAAETEASRDGRLELTYSTLPAGKRLRVWLEFQVDPTNVGRRAYGVELDDGTEQIARIDRHLTILP
jgi:hypothetical protein